MLLYHGTTFSRGQEIINTGALYSDCKRYFTKELNNDEATTNGYVYLSNEITWALRFCVLHGYNCEHSDKAYLFKLNIPEEVLLPDEDELKYVQPHVVERYSDRLMCSLSEYKSCRVSFDISLKKFNAEFCIIHLSEESNELLENNVMNFEYVISHYTQKQKIFMKSLDWKRV